jgi:hypothetical protein
LTAGPSSKDPDSERLLFREASFDILGEGEEDDGNEEADIDGEEEEARS